MQVTVWSWPNREAMCIIGSRLVEVVLTKSFGVDIIPLWASEFGVYNARSGFALTWPFLAMLPFPAFGIITIYFMPLDILGFIF